jgi:hypothetical protein
MDRLDDLVLEHLQERLFAPERLEELLGYLMARVRDGEAERKAKRKALDRELSESDKAIRRLYELVERGLSDLDDTLKARLRELKQRREEILYMIAVTERKLAAPRHVLSPKKLAAFSAAMRQHLRHGEPAFRKAYLRLFVDRIEVDDEEIRISGPKSALERGVAAGSELQPWQVPSSVLGWRPHGDSNPGLRRESALQRRSMDIHGRPWSLQTIDLTRL